MTTRQSTMPRRAPSPGGRTKANTTRPHVLTRAALALAAAALFTPACTTTAPDRAPSTAAPLPATALRPAAILHIVLIRLKNPLDTAELADDCLAAAADIPAITSAFAGLHLETGRDTVTRDYDLCFTLGFDTRDALEAYTAHPAHTALLEKWRARIEWLRIHDAQDVRP